MGNDTIVISVSKEDLDATGRVILEAGRWCKIFYRDQPRPRGKWVNPINGGWSVFLDCSNCGGTLQWLDPYKRPDFCPMCGADMRQSEIKIAIGRLPSSEPKLDKKDMPEQGDSAKFGVITGETCAYWDSESNMCALHRPSAQPEIIHCKECKRQDTDNVFRSMWCHEMRTFVKPNEFCSRADMREEEQDE